MAFCCNRHWNHVSQIRPLCYRTRKGPGARALPVVHLSFPISSSGGGSSGLTPNKGFQQFWVIREYCSKWVLKWDELGARFPRGRKVFTSASMEVTECEATPLWEDAGSEARQVRDIHFRIPDFHEFSHHLAVLRSERTFISWWWEGMHFLIQMAECKVSTWRENVLCYKLKQKETIFFM